MMQKKIKKIYFSILVGFLFWGLSGHCALAQMQSPNFQIKSDVIGSFGADSTSPNFQLNDTGGEVGGEVLSGNGQDLWGGFWHNLSGGVFADVDGDGIGDTLDNCPEDSNVSQNDSDNDGVGNACDNCQSDSNSNQSDADNDGVGNVCDNCRDADNTNQNDSDNDDIGNACDNCPDNSNNSQTDSDNDGVGNACDNCALVANSSQADSDNDGVGDACEPPVDNDTDSDGILNSADNCPSVYNPLQEDTDMDGTGDICDADMDGDSVINVSDNCPLISNADQADMDNDGAGNACDADQDGDGLNNDSDNCPQTPNFDQNDSDSDNLGDACDSDLDGDGVANASDNCALVFNPDQSDADNDNIGDACDSGLDSDGDGLENNVDNCPLIVNPTQADGDRDGFGDVCDLSGNTPAEILRVIRAEAISKDKGIIGKIVSAISNIEQLTKKIEKEAQKEERTITIAKTAAAVISILPTLSNVNSIKDLGLIIANSFGSLFGLVFRRRRDWGIVYDVDTGNPISLVSIGIVNQAGRTLDKRITDKVGSYVLLVPQGKYSLEIEKEGYRLAEKDIQFRTLYANNYYGGELDIENYDTINFNIPMRAESVNEGESIHLKAVGQRGLFLRLFYFFTTLIFYAGFALSIVSIFILPDKKVALSILVAYLFGGLLRNFVANEKGWGKVIGQTGKSAPFATVRAFNKSDGEFVVRTISDELGRYVLILRKGGYTLSVDGVGEGRWSGEVKVGRTSVLKKMIRLSNASDSLTENKPKS